MSSLSSTDSDEFRQHLRAELEPIVMDHGAVLVDVEMAGSKSQPVLRLLVHRDPGIPLDLCEAISREVADYLDVEDPIPGRYRLEVTSPGLDRPLQTDGDFARARQRLVKVVLASGRNYRGRLLDWDAEVLRIEAKKGVEEVVRAEIAKATIEVEFNRQGRP